MTKNTINIQCPVCGSQLSVTEANNAVNTPKTHKQMNAEAKIEALRNAGVNVSNLFSMKGADGGDAVARLQNGQLSIVADDDPIFQTIFNSGTVPNPKLFRRWVMAQVFHMLSYASFGSQYTFTRVLQLKGYKYQWKMVLEEMRVQAKLEGADKENFAARNRWFNRERVAMMCQDYIMKLKAHVAELKVRHCKGVQYVRIGRNDVFVADLYSKVFRPLEMSVRQIEAARNAQQLHAFVSKFVALAKKWWLRCDIPMPNAFVDSYKGAGAYFTMKNLILFHGASFKNGCVKVGQKKSLQILEDKAKEYEHEGWRLFGLMKKLINDSGIDIEKKMEEWRK